MDAAPLFKDDPDAARSATRLGSPFPPSYRRPSVVASLALPAAALSALLTFLPLSFSAVVPLAHPAAASLSLPAVALPILATVVSLSQQESVLSQQESDYRRPSVVASLALPAAAPPPPSAVAAAHTTTSNHYCHCCTASQSMAHPTLCDDGVTLVAIIAAGDAVARVAAEDGRSE